MSIPLVALSFGDAHDTRSPVLMLHGLFGSGRNWSAIARSLSETGRRIFTLDLPNHGQSGWTTEPVSYALMAEAVEAWMEDHAIPSVILQGHSMGGKTAMTLALRSPDRVKALIVVDIAPVAYSGQTYLSYIQAMEGVSLEGISRRVEVEQALQKTVASTDLRRFLVQNLEVRDDGGGLRWRINLPVLAQSLPALMDFSFPGEMKSYTGPTLFLAGENSEYVISTYAPVMARFFPLYRQETISDTGHWPHAERPMEVLSAIRRFLDIEGL